MRFIQGRFNVSIIGNKSRLTGMITSNESIRLEGDLVGNIKTKTKVVVGPEGYLHGSIQGRFVDISGKIEGEIIASELVILRKGASVTGSFLMTPQLYIEQGAVINSKVIMGEMMDDENEKIPLASMNQSMTVSSRTKSDPTMIKLTVQR